MPASRRCCSPSRGASAPAWKWRSRRWRGWCGPSSRPCTATTRSSTTGSSSSGSASRAWCSSTTSTQCPGRRAAHVVGARLGTRSGCRGAAPRPLRRRTRCARSSPRCITRPRSAPARDSRSSTSATPATTRRSARSRSRPTRSGSSKRAEELDASPADLGDRPASCACSRRRRSRTASGRSVLDQARARYPNVWTASRNDLCFATTNRQTALSEIAQRADAVVVIGSANSSNTLALAQGRQSRRRCPIVLRVDGPERDRSGPARPAHASWESRPARAHPKSSSPR